MSKHTWTDISSVCLSHPLFQKRTTPLLWWACVGPWPPSQAASLWLASSPASAWLTSAQRTVLPSLPARGHQRNTANHLTDTETIQHEYKKTTFGRRTNALFRGPCVSPFTFTLWAQLSLNLHLLSEKVAFLSGTVQQRYRNSCSTAWRPPSVSLSLIVLTWLSLLKCKQLVQVWSLILCTYSHVSVPVTFIKTHCRVVRYCQVVCVLSVRQCILFCLLHNTDSAGRMSYYKLLGNRNNVFAILYYTIRREITKGSLIMC